MANVLILSSFPVSTAELAEWVTCEQGCATKHTFSLSAKGNHDFVLILNWARKVTRVKVPKNRVVKLVQEPPVPGSLTHRFVNHHSSSVAVVRGHALSQPVNYTNAVHERGFLFIPSKVPPRVGGEDKDQLASLVASTLNALPGHQARNRFIDEATAVLSKYGVDVFGRGRRLLERKEDALDRYMYSIAIENTSIPGYLSEKFTDVILRDAVPIYYGDPEATRLFPKEAFIQLADLSAGALDDCLRLLGPSDYNRRLPYLRQAKDMLIRDYRICCWVSSLIARSEPSKEVVLVFGLEVSAILTRVRVGLGSLIQKALPRLRST